MSVRTAGEHDPLPRIVFEIIRYLCARAHRNISHMSAEMSLNTTQNHESKLGIGFKHRNPT